MFTFGKTFRSWINEESRKLLAVDYDQISELYLENTELIIESLENLKGVYKSSLISFYARVSSTRDGHYWKWCLC